MTSADLQDRKIVAGWSRRTFRVAATARVLDVGSGAFPNPEADVLCDLEVDDDVHRHGLGLVIDRPFVVARVEALPFRDGAFDFVIASHIAEHVTDPAGFCAELRRVATAGYVETPSPAADALLHEEYHIWRVGSRRGVLVFKRKATTRNRFVAAITERIYRLYYAGRSDCSRRTWSLPKGRVGQAFAFALKAVGAGLSRIGVMHTRFAFDQSHPMQWRVEP